LNSNGTENTCRPRTGAIAKTWLERLSRPTAEYQRSLNYARGWFTQPPKRTPNSAGCTPPQPIFSEGLRPSNSPTRSLARRFVASLRSRGSLAALTRAAVCASSSDSPARSLCRLLDRRPDPPQSGRTQRVRTASRGRRQRQERHQHDGPRERARLGPRTPPSSGAVLT
jgi:hypothetical protein